MNGEELISLNRDCEAIQIPSGAKMKLPEGTRVRISQSLGDTYTVITDEGYMVRIAGRDADALGLEVPQQAQAQPGTPPANADEIEKLVWEQLKSCYDPEIPVNIADLGLVYLCVVKPLSADSHRVEIKLTLTAPGCGMGDILRQDVESKVLTVPGVAEADVEVVFDPPWNQTMMSEAARLQLGLL